ncbi:MAG: gamma-glutamyl-gamma-aminobutyrate hydrolase family protein [Phycisphaerales bacterium]|nr:gamma-glutamyl-gamma-aminobutyrate hydrolase family protein [Phycisphaerales bacterium]
MTPLVGITCDLDAAREPVRAQAALAYARAVCRAGGAPVLLPPVLEALPGHLLACAAFVLTGGDDPRTEPFGAPTHPRATPVHPERQAYETALLRALSTQAPDRPVLGICLGMQMMGLVAGGTLDQCMTETLGDAADAHWKRPHAVLIGGESAGEAASSHRQRLLDPGSLQVIARAPDGVIEGVCDAGRAHYVGVQWHPERTADERLGLDCFRSLVRAAGGR